MYIKVLITLCVFDTRAHTNLHEGKTDKFRRTACLVR